MRILHAADFHIEVRRYGTVTPTGSSRIADFGATLARAVAAANDHADLLVLAGDTFDNRRPGPEGLSALTTALADRRTSVVIIPGNHDGRSTVGSAETHSLNWMVAAALPGVHVLTTPGWHRLSLPGGGVSIFALPYPHKRALDAELADVPVDERPARIAERLEQSIEVLAPGAWMGDDPRIFIGHVSTLGAHLSSETAMKVGWDVAIRPEVLRGFDAALLGHIHRQQQVAENAWYCGSPEYMDFGEVTQPKGFLLWDVKAGDRPAIRPGFIPSGARPMAVVTLGQNPDGMIRSPDGDLPDLDGAMIRLDLDCHVRPTPTDVAAAVRLLRARGASYIKVQITVATPEQTYTGIWPTRIAVDADADIIETLGRWLSEKGHPEEPALTAGRDLVASLGD